MARKTYREYVAELSPTVLLGEWAERIAGATIGVMHDLLAEWDMQAVKSGLLTSNTFPSDALALSGEDRMSPRYAVDTDDTYNARLVDSWERWAQAATRQGIVAELAAFGVTANIISNSEWDWDGDADNWSRFWVIITGHSWTGPRVLGDGSVLDGTWTLGSSATVEEVNTVREIVRRLKPAHEVCSHIIVVLDADAWDSDGTPDGTWGKPWNRSSSACYWPG